MIYRAEIDGLRAVAVIPVILFHAGFRQFGGGYVGVDVFFVISGYLITSVILSDLADGRFSFAGFYERRARRILPALFLVIAACIPFAWYFLIPKDLQYFSQSVIATALCISNFLFWHKSIYFGENSDLVPLLHTWSLAVEEQYYLFFPIFFVIAYRLSRRRVPAILAAICVLSLAAAEWGAHHKPSAAFYLLPTRGWEILIGAVAAMHLSTDGKAIQICGVAEALSLAGLGMILGSVFLFTAETPAPSLFTLIPTFGALLIILFATDGTFTGRLLSHPSLVGVGLISYSAYLWHHPLFAFARYASVAEPSHLTMAGLCLAILPLSYLSWRFVERPVRRRNGFSRKTVLGSLFGIACAMAAMGYIGDKFEGFGSRFFDSDRYLLSFLGYPRGEPYREGSCFLKPEQSFGDFGADCFHENSKILIWGDSHAAALSYGLRHTEATTSQLTASACPPIVDVQIRDRPNCMDINKHFLDLIEKGHPTAIFLHAAWSNYAFDLRANIEKTVATLRHLAPGARIFVIGDVPQWAPSLPIVLIREKVVLRNVTEVLHSTAAIDRTADADKVLSSAVTPGQATFVSLLSLLCQSGKCVSVVPSPANEPLAWDDAHLTKSGAIYVAARLLATPVISQALK